MNAINPAPAPERADGAVDRETLACALYQSVHPEAHSRRVAWSDMPEETLQIWRRCADSAIAFIDISLLEKLFGLRTELEEQKRFSLIAGERAAFLARKNLRLSRALLRRGGRG